MASLKTKELAEWLNISPATVRLWTKEDEFGIYLSPVGRGGGGRNRSFADTDARIIAFIHALKNQGSTRDEINATLTQLKAENWQALPPMPQAPPGVNTAVINAETASTALITQRNALLREISLLEERNERLEDMLEKSLADKDALQAELGETKEQLGQLRGQLEVIKKERPPATFWFAVLLGVAVAVSAIIAGITLFFT